jgi:hypothetical protein
MLAHAEPVIGWGFEPCGKLSFPTTARVSGWGGAVPRPTGTGRGSSEVQTSLNRTPRTNGRRHLAGGFENGDQHERRPSPATAPSPCSVLDHHLQDGGCSRAGGKPRCKMVVATRVVGDLGNSPI